MDFLSSSFHHLLSLLLKCISSHHLNPTLPPSRMKFRWVSYTIRESIEFWLLSNWCDISWILVKVDMRVFGLKSFRVCIRVHEVHVICYKRIYSCRFNCFAWRFIHCEWLLLFYYLKWFWKEFLFARYSWFFRFLWLFLWLLLWLPLFLFFFWNWTWTNIRSYFLFLFWNLFFKMFIDHLL